ncbi:MAG TPA: energy transducer TonB [Spirochaetota bacterium]|nr:energy transducer TonB [Spirochaetota bacterium]HPI89255.1 energy transducer TonB [Spirochaetota bacterium]HPR48585.1 energy transducer TonB [Spirochaetota bacterium]
MTEKNDFIHGVEGSVAISALPLYNSFENLAAEPWFKRHSVVGIFLITALVGYTAFSINWNILDDIKNRKYDQMAVTVVDFGDFVPISKRRAGANYVEIDEVFGNQYIKKDAKELDPDRDIVDPRIGTAVNHVMANATAPIDLSPQIAPEYTARARAAGIEGTIILELIISEDGEVLRAKPVGKILGMGLEQAAVQCYERKRFKPSMNSDGKTITVKIYQPVRFELL